MTSNENHAAHFPSTSWDLLAAIRGGGDAGRLALEEFTGRYYDPAFRYLRAIIRDDEDARDLTQGFFLTKILAGNMIDQAKREKGGFRPYLKQSLRYCAIDFLRRHRADLPVDDYAIAQAPDAEREFHDACIKKIVEVAIAVLLKECTARHQDQHYKLFHAYYIAGLQQGDESLSWKTVGSPFGLDEKTARNRAETALASFRRIVYTLAVQEVGSENAAREEFDFLRSAASMKMVRLLNFAVGRHDALAPSAQ